MISDDPASATQVFIEPQRSVLHLENLPTRDNRHGALSSADPAGDRRQVCEKGIFYVDSLLNNLQND